MTNKLNVSKYINALDKSKKGAQNNEAKPRKRVAIQD